MPSAFPGMDPYIEGQAWADFHHHLATEIKARLVPQIRPRYVARLCGREYVEHQQGHIRVREIFLELRLRDSGDLGTVIEVLSPSNKRLGSDGRKEYLNKRLAVLASTAHLVEIDLLRGGARLPMGRALPPGDYYAILSRVERRPFADVWPCALRDRLPAVPIPLAGEDPDAILDLQDAVNAVYDRAGYDYSIDYRQAVAPALSEKDAAWAQSILHPEEAPSE